MTSAIPAAGRPSADEAAPYYFKYIDRVTSDRPLEVLRQQLHEVDALLSKVSGERSLYRYAEDKWSMRGVISHVNDCERVFAFRAFWFARGLPGPLPSFDQDIAAKEVRADLVSWGDLLEEFRQLRRATIALFEHLPAEAWSRGGEASGYNFTVRALAFILAGHVAHHLAILQEHYLRDRG